MTSSPPQLLTSPLRISRSTFTSQVCFTMTSQPNRCRFYSRSNVTLLLFCQAPSSCSCLIPNAGTPAGSSGGAGTPPTPTAMGHLATRTGWATAGPTTPCWPRHGGRACWATRGWLTDCLETSGISAPTRTTDCSTSGTAVRRKWPELPDLSSWPISEELHTGLSDQACGSLSHWLSDKSFKYTTDHISWQKVVGLITSALMGWQVYTVLIHNLVLLYQKLVKRKID